MMSSTDDDPSTVNGRLRPRKSSVPGTPRARSSRKSDPKHTEDKSKKPGTPSKKAPEKSEDFEPNSPAKKTPEKDDEIKPNTPPRLKVFCPYCDKKFASKKAVSKHVGRIHLNPAKQEFFECQYCKQTELDGINIIRHMVDSHPNQYFACLECHTRFPSTSELAIHKLNVCEKSKPLSAKPYRNKLRQKIKNSQKRPKSLDSNEEFPADDKRYPDAPEFNGIVISCELKPSQGQDPADIEDNITTNLILPPNKNIGNGEVLDKNAVIVLDDIQWNKRIPSNFSFHNTDTDQILSRLGVVHRSPRTSEHTRRDWYKQIEDSTKFERCFDTTFYSKVAGNVQENLTKFLEGSFNRFHIDPENIIKTRKPKTNINTAEGFPILLASEQYSRNLFESYMPRAIAPRHKWKWDSVEADRLLLNPDQIKRDSHVNNCIITLVSNLDIWTQLRMRLKFEAKFNNTSYNEKKTEKQSIVSNELKQILESREIPKPQMQVAKFNAPKTTSNREGLDFPSSLGLMPATPKYEIAAAVLSGEWTRPRCYVCCACGARAEDSRALNVHIGTQHPLAQVSHYEVVGESLLNADILKYLYVPPSQPVNKTRPIRGIRNECTKCRKPIGLDELHQHMLECAGDTPVVRRKVRTRPFGVRRRRQRLPENTIRKTMRKRMRARQTRQKVHMRPRPRIRTEVGDAETIRKMLADLPAKRHRVVVNPNPNLRPIRRREQTRNKIIMKRCHSDDSNKTRKLRGGKVTPASSIPEASVNEEENLSNDVKNTAPKRKARVANKIMRQSEALRRKTLMRQAKRKAHAIIKQTANIESSEEKRASTVSSSAVQTDDIPLGISSNDRIDVNKGTAKSRGHAARDNSNNQDGRKPAGNEQDTSRNSAPPTNNTPLKHSIASLTANTERHDKSVQFQPHFLVQQECYKNVDRFRPAGQPTLFENETAAHKLDKPPLEGLSQRFDTYNLQKNKDKQKRKGLNACIAMLKNKQKIVEPENEEVVASGHRSVQCDTADMPPYEEPPLPHVPSPEQLHTHSETIYQAQETAITPAAPYSPVPAHAADYLPLDLSGKPPSHKPTDYSGETLDLSNKNREVEAAVTELINPQEEEEEEEEEVDAVDLCINTTDIGVTLDLSKGPKNKNDDLPQNYMEPSIHQSDVYRNHGYATAGPSQDYNMHQIEQLDLSQRPPHRLDGPSHDYSLMHAQHQMELATRHRYEHELSPPDYGFRSVQHADLLKRARYTENILPQDLNSVLQSDLTQRHRLNEHDINQGYAIPTGHQMDLSQRPMNRNDILAQNYAAMQIQQPIQQMDIPQRYNEDVSTYAQDYTIMSGQPMILGPQYMGKELHSHEFAVLPPRHHETNKLRRHRHKDRSLPRQDSVLPPAEKPISDDAPHLQQFGVQPVSLQLDLSQKLRSKEVLPHDPHESHHEPRNEVILQECHDLSRQSIPPQDHSIIPVVMDTHNKYIENRDTAENPVQREDITTKSKRKRSLHIQDSSAQPIEFVQKVNPVAASENISPTKSDQLVDPVSVIENVPPVNRPTIEPMPPVNPVHKEATPEITSVTMVYTPQTKPAQIMETMSKTKLVNVTEAVTHTKPVQKIEPVVQTKPVSIKEPVRPNKPVQAIEPVPQSKPVEANKPEIEEIKDGQKTVSLPKVKPRRKNVPAKQSKKLKRRKRKTKVTPQELIENEIEQIDLSKEDTDEDIKTPLIALLETDPNKEHEAKDITEVVNDAKVVDHSKAKSVYDPNLKIPQYKIRVTEANSTSSDTPSAAKIVSNDLPTPSPIASLANAIREYANAMNISTVSSIESTHRLQTTSPLLYTEAGTSTSLATNTLPTGSLGALIATTSTSPSSIGAELDAERSQIVVPISSVQDLEIAKKIAMLPKEIVEILGRMPPHHRNQLLNILPQYMTYNTSVKQLKLVVDISPEAKCKSNMSKSEIATQTSGSVEPACPPEFLNVDTEKYLIDPVTGALTERKEKDLESDVKPIPEIIQECEVIEILEDSPNDIKNDKYEHIELETPQQPKEKTRSSTETNKEPTFITPPATTASLSKLKESNEMTTASLRAVRIKPSERRKSQLLAAKIAEQPLPAPIVISPLPMNLEIDQSKPLAIQQAEVSSTQHSSNRNVMVDSVVPLVTKENEAKVTMNNKERRISTGIDEHDANNVALETIVTVAPNVVVGIDPPTTETQRQRRTSKRIEKNLPVVVIDGRLNAQPLINETSSIPIKNKEIPPKDITESTDTDVTLQDSELKTNEITLANEDLTIKQSNSINNDDDSDDDISLAVIVKQKQLSDKNTPTLVIGDMSPDNEFSKKKGKGRKQKKLKKAENNTEIVNVPIGLNQSAKNASLHKYDGKIIKNVDIASNQNTTVLTEKLDTKIISEIEKVTHIENTIKINSDVSTVKSQNIEFVSKKRRGRRNVAKSFKKQSTDAVLTDINYTSSNAKNKEYTDTVTQHDLSPIDKILQPETETIVAYVVPAEEKSEVYESLYPENTLLTLRKEDIPKTKEQFPQSTEILNKKDVPVEIVSTENNIETKMSKKKKFSGKRNKKKTKPEEVKISAAPAEELKLVHDKSNGASEKPLKEDLLQQNLVVENAQKEKFPINIDASPNEMYMVPMNTYADKPVEGMDKIVNDDDISKSKRFRKSKNKDSSQLNAQIVNFSLKIDASPTEINIEPKNMYTDEPVEEIVKIVNDDETSKSKRLRRSKNKDSSQLSVTDDMFIPQISDADATDKPVDEMNKIVNDDETSKSKRFRRSKNKDSSQLLVTDDMSTPQIADADAADKPVDEMDKIVNDDETCKSKRFRRSKNKVSSQLSITEEMFIHQVADTINKPIEEMDKIVNDDETNNSKRFRRSKNKDSSQLSLTSDMFVPQFTDANTIDKPRTTDKIVNNDETSKSKRFRRSKNVDALPNKLNIEPTNTYTDKPVEEMDKIDSDDKTSKSKRFRRSKNKDRSQLSVTNDQFADAVAYTTDKQVEEMDEIVNDDETSKSKCIRRSKNKDSSQLSVTGDMFVPQFADADADTTDKEVDEMDKIDNDDETNKSKRIRRSKNKDNSQLIAHIENFSINIDASPKEMNIEPTNTYTDKPFEELDKIINDDECKSKRFSRSKNKYSSQIIAQLENYPINIDASPNEMNIEPTNTYTDNPIEEMDKIDNDDETSKSKRFRRSKTKDSTQLLVTDDMCTPQIADADVADKPVDEMDKIVNDDETSKSKRFRRSKTKDSSQLPVTGDMFVPQLPETDADTQPLRRSRRGKSMYVEPVSESKEQTPAETFVENRAPFTKKHLIFSKLLLDEENAKAIPVLVEKVLGKEKSKANEDSVKTQEVCNSIIINKVNVEIQEEQIYVTKAESSAEKLVEKSTALALLHDEQPVYINENNETLEVKMSTGNSKTVKRKKPAQTKLSNKKKKSRDVIQSRDSSIENAGTTSEINISLQDQYDTINISPSISAKECNTIVEVINKRADNLMITKISNDKSKEHNKENDTTERVQKVQSDKNTNRKEKSHVDNPVDSSNKDKNNTYEVIEANVPNYAIPGVITKTSKGKGNRSIEKRKISNHVMTSATQSPTPKKTKKQHDSILETPGVGINIETDANTDQSKGVQEILTTPKDNSIKTTPCYDMPKAVARTRSKSVLIKSLNVDDAYDPYDIDLEENLLQNIDVIPKKSHKSYESLTPVTSKNIAQEKNKKKKCRTVSASDISTPNNVIVCHEESTPPPTSTNDAEDNSDTDDSTKSDIPLKSIKTNKKSKSRKGIGEIVNDNKSREVEEKSKGRKKKNLAVIKRKKQQIEVDAIVEETAQNTEDNAEELRSEQFMESFGFFSERKPRKSNLLASKKISETFHTIASENEDLDYSSKERERTNKRRNEERDRERERIRSPSLSVSDSESNHSMTRQIPHCIARRKKGKKRVRDPATYCQTCDKEFRRPDNLVRHHLSLFHISRLLKKEMDVDIEPIKEEPNFLLVYKQHLERLKRLTERIARKNKKLGIDAPPKIRMPTFAEIMSDVRVQAYSLAHHTRRGLSRDEALFLHCCEMLKESHTTAEIGLPPDLEPVHRLIAEERGDCKSDGDVDSITAKNILESEEVRNLENDFITGLKETLNVADDASVTTLKASDECLASTSRGESTKVVAYNVQHYSSVYTHQIPVTVHMMSYTVNDPRLSSNLHTVSSQKPEAVETKSMTVHKKPKSAKHRAISLDDKIQPRTSTDSGTDTASHTKSKSSPKDLDLYDNLDDDYIEEPVVKKSINRITEILEFDMFEDKFDKIKRKCRSQTAAQSAAAAAAAATTKPSQLPVVVEQKSHKTRKKAEKKKTKKSCKKNQSMILTKGALKGFDGIKVSIPTSDINMSAIIPDSLSKKKKKSSGKKKKSRRESGSSLKYDNEERGSSPIPPSTRQKDVYEFEDNDDVMFEFRPTTMKERFKMVSKESVRVEPRGAGDAARGAVDEPLSGAESDDGDDFVYMSDDYLCSPSADETEASVDVDSGKLAADPKRSASFKRKDVVEKNAVMGKIFKNNAVKKFSAKGKEPVKSANLDQLFDSLLEDEPNSSMLKDDSDPMLASSPVLGRNSPPKNIDHDTLDSLLNKSPEMIRKSPDTISSGSSERPMSPARSRGDWSPMLSPPRMTYHELLNMPSTSSAPPPSLEDYYALDPGAERRHRARRKCTVGKQNVLAETWSSESEVEVGGPGGEERRRRGPRNKGSQHRRPKQVTFKKSEESRVLGVSVAPVYSGVSGQGTAEAGVPAGGGVGGGSTPAAEWGAPAPQHGWIVGNSHKKLVTMLAHAKGRKRDDKRPYVE